MGNKPEQSAEIGVAVKEPEIAGFDYKPVYGTYMAMPIGLSGVYILEPTEGYSNEPPSQLSPKTIEILRIISKRIGSKEKAVEVICENERILQPGNVRLYINENDAEFIVRGIKLSVSRKKPLDQIFSISNCQLITHIITYKSKTSCCDVFSEQYIFSTNYGDYVSIVI